MGRKTKKQLKLEALEKDLMVLIDANNAIELEKVARYVNLVSIFDDLDKSIKDKGAIVLTVNGSQEFYKANPAISEKVKVNAALIKLDSFFDKKHEEYETKKAKSNDIDMDDFT